MLETESGGAGQHDDLFSVNFTVLYHFVIFVEYISAPIHLLVVYLTASTAQTQSLEEPWNTPLLPVLFSTRNIVDSCICSELPRPEVYDIFLMPYIVDRADLWE